jgi:hypothetical protein
MLPARALAAAASLTLLLVATSRRLREPDHDGSGRRPHARRGIAAPRPGRSRDRGAHGLRSHPRPVGAGPDVGAYELRADGPWRSACCCAGGRAGTRNGRSPISEKRTVIKHRLGDFGRQSLFTPSRLIRFQAGSEGFSAYSCRASEPGDALGGPRKDWTSKKSPLTWRVVLLDSLSTMLSEVQSCQAGDAAASVPAALSLGNCSVCGLTPRVAVAVHPADGLGLDGLLGLVGLLGLISLSGAGCGPPI